MFSSRKHTLTFALFISMAASVAGCPATANPDTGPNDTGVVDTGTRTDTGPRDVTNPPDTQNMDTGTTDTGNPSDTGNPDDVPIADTGADSGCSTPSMLHPGNPDAGATIYCPFSNPDGGRAEYCMQLSQHCCEPSSGTAMCSPLATPCPSTDTDWQCEDPATDCPAGQLCCGTGTLVIAPPGCGNFATGFHGTHCATSCAVGEIRMCTSDMQCNGGQTCVPFKTKGNSVGGCH